MTQITGGRVVYGRTVQPAQYESKKSEVEFAFAVEDGAFSQEALDGIIKTAMEKAQSVDPAVVAKTLPEIKFNSVYGPAAFGGKQTYGTPQQILVPVIVTQMDGKKLVEVQRIEPAELKQRLAQ